MKAGLSEKGVPQIGQDSTVSAHSKPQIEQILLMKQVPRFPFIYLQYNNKWAV